MIGMVGILFEAILILFGFACLWAGLKGVFTARSESYDSQSLQTNFWASILLILLGLLFVSRFVYSVAYLWKFI